MGEVLTPWQKPGWVEGPDGTTLPYEPQLQFTGSGVAAITDDAEGRRTVVELNAGGGELTMADQNGNQATGSAVYVSRAPLSPPAAGVSVTPPAVQQTEAGLINLIVGGFPTATLTGNGTSAAPIGSGQWTVSNDTIGIDTADDIPTGTYALFGAITLTAPGGVGAGATGALAKTLQVGNYSHVEMALAPFSAPQAQTFKVLDIFTAAGQLQLAAAFGSLASNGDVWNVQATAFSAALTLLKLA